MVKIIFADNSEVEVLAETAVYPSSNQNQRSKMEIYLAETAMKLDAFEVLFTNESKTNTIHIVDTVNGSDITYANYTFVSSIGKKNVSSVDYKTGATVNEKHLVVEIEQLTYIEQQLKKLGLM